MRRVLEEQAEDEDMEPGGADPFGTGVSIFYSTDQGVPPGTVFMESVYKTAIVATDTARPGAGRSRDPPPHRAGARHKRSADMEHGRLGVTPIAHLGMGGLRPGHRPGGGGETRSGASR